MTTEELCTIVGARRREANTIPSSPPESPKCLQESGRPPQTPVDSRGSGVAKKTAGNRTPTPESRATSPICVSPPIRVRFPAPPPNSSANTPI